MLNDLWSNLGGVTPSQRVNQTKQLINWSGISLNLNFFLRENIANSWNYRTLNLLTITKKGCLSSHGTYLFVTIGEFGVPYLHEFAKGYYETYMYFLISWSLKMLLRVYVERQRKYLKIAWHREWSASLNVVIERIIFTTKGDFLVWNDHILVRFWYG